MRIARDSLALFRRRDFAFLMGAQWLAQAADGLVGVSLAKKIAFGGQAGFELDEARTPEEMLRIVLLTVLPYTLLSPLLGVLIDRWDRRRMLLAANGFRAAALTLVVLVGIDTIGDAALYGSFLLILASTRLLLAIKGASLPVVLGERDLLHGNSISQAGSAIFQVSGAAVGLVASGLLPTRIVLIGGIAAYGLAAGAAFVIRRLGYTERSVPLVEELRRLLRDLGEGIREIGRRPPAALSLTAFLMLRALFSFVLLAMALAAREFIVEEGTLTTAISAAAGAVGAGLGFVAAHALKDRVPPERLVVSAMLLSGAGMIAFGGIITLAGLVAVGFVLGLGFFLGKVAADTLMQQSLHDSFRGRGFGLQDLAYNLSWILPAVVLWVTWSDGTARTLLIGAGALYLASAVAMELWARKIARDLAPAGVPSGD